MTNISETHPLFARPTGASSSRENYANIDEIQSPEQNEDVPLPRNQGYPIIDTPDEQLPRFSVRLQVIGSVNRITICEQGRKFGHQNMKGSRGGGLPPPQGSMLIFPGFRPEIRRSPLIFSPIRRKGKGSDPRCSSIRITFLLLVPKLRRDSLHRDQAPDWSGHCNLCHWRRFYWIHPGHDVHLSFSNKCL